MRLKGWIWFIGILITLNLLLGMFGRQYRFDSILIHHSAGRVGDLAMIRAIHEKRGWSDAAYHLLLSNGSTDVPIGFLEATRHFESLSFSGATKNHEANMRDLQICIVGNYDTDDLPETMQSALAHALLALCEEFSIDQNKIVFHRDVDNTACPGKHLTKENIFSWMQNSADECPEAVRLQQLKTIESSSLSWSNYPAGLLIIQLCVSTLFTLIWSCLVFAFGSSSKRRTRASTRNPRFHSARTCVKRKKSKKNRHI